MSEFKEGDKAQYNKVYNPKEVVNIVKIDCDHCIVEFPSGYKLVTRLNSLYPVFLHNGSGTFDKQGLTPLVPAS